MGELGPETGFTSEESASNLPSTISGHVWERSDRREAGSGARCRRLVEATRRTETSESVETGEGVLEFQKLLHPVQCLVQRQMKGAAAWPRADKAQLVLQPAIDHLQIGPAQYLLAP